MRKPGGYAILTTPETTRVEFDRLRCETLPPGVFEADTFTCVHCNRVVHVKPAAKDDDYYFCRNCMARICPPCADHPCRPFMRQIEEQEQRDRMYRAAR